jgi:tRNA(Ile)-lysidine synthase
VAVRECLAGLPSDVPVLVACSGGPDSLALAAVTAWEAPRLGHPTGALVVDHGLQDGSEEVAARAAEQCRALGLSSVQVLRVQVGSEGGPESAARDARYAALEQAAEASGSAYVLLGHTQKDQAEQVLLGLARGSGARSLSGMPRRRGRFLRAFLALPGSTTREVCAAEGLTPWEDPHNADPTYRRVRARRLLDRLEHELGPGVVAGLARSAGLLRTDADTLDALAVTAREELGPGPWEAQRLAVLPDGIRTRVWRRLVEEAGTPRGALFAVHVRSLDALVSRWRGQGQVDLPGGVRASRTGGRVSIERAGPVQWEHTGADSLDGPDRPTTDPTTHPTT